LLLSFPMLNALRGRSELASALIPPFSPPDSLLGNFLSPPCQKLLTYPLTYWAFLLFPPPPIFLLLKPTHLTIPQQPAGNQRPPRHLFVALGFHLTLISPTPSHSQFDPLCPNRQDCQTVSRLKVFRPTSPTPPGSLGTTAVRFSKDTFLSNCLSCSPSPRTPVLPPHNHTLYGFGGFFFPGSSSVALGRLSGALFSPFPQTFPPPTGAARTLSS